MPATTSQLLTVEEFRKLPEDSGPVYHELRHGEITTVTRSKLKDILLQHRLRDLLRPLAEAGSFVGVGLPFRALPEDDLRVADVAYVSAARFAAADPDDNIHGAPDLVIEVLSLSNTAAEIYDKEKLCLEHGAKEFWVVDVDRAQVKVSTPDGRTMTWHSGQEIPLPLLNDARIVVDDLFA